VRGAVGCQRLLVGSWLRMSVRRRVEVRARSCWVCDESCALSALRVAGCGCGGCPLPGVRGHHNEYIKGIYILNLNIGTFITSISHSNHREDSHRIRRPPATDLHRDNRPHREHRTPTTPNTDHLLLASCLVPLTKAGCCCCSRESSSLQVRIC
jgi:hypothetical protein